MLLGGVMGRGKGKGLTLLELLVVLSVLLLLGAIGYSASLQSYRLRAGLAELKTFLRSSQLEAIRREATLAVVLEGGRLSVCEDTACARALRTLDLGELSGEVSLVSRGSPKRDFRINAFGRPDSPIGLKLAIGNKVGAICFSRGGRIGEVVGRDCD
jgi:prepilin-type N-terminal cleavage/methylation domain-containing protein